jgi:hypothetical protein
MMHRRGKALRVLDKNSEQKRPLAVPRHRLDCITKELKNT